MNRYIMKTGIGLAFSLILLFSIKMVTWSSAFCTWAYCYRPVLILLVTGGTFLTASWFVMKKMVSRSIAVNG